MSAVGRDDLAAILVPGRVLSDEDVIALHQALSPPWMARQQRLDARDIVVRQLATLHADKPVTAVARLIARLLDRHLAGREAEHGKLLERIAVLNDRRPLSSRQCFDVLKGARTVVR